MSKSEIEVRGVTEQIERSEAYLWWEGAEVALAVPTEHISIFKRT